MTKEDEYKYRIDKVIDYINDNLNKEINVEKLAEISAFSPFHFHRIARVYLGEPIGVFVVRQRMQKAARSLVFDSISITDIAYQVGYDVPSSLTKAFVKHFGIPPTEYREINNYRIMKAQHEVVEINISRAKVIALEPKKVIYISARGKYANIDFGAIYQTLWGEIKRQKAYSAGIESLGLYYDDPNVTEESKMRCDVCLRVVKHIEPNGVVSVKTIAGGRYAVFTYTGAYSNLNHAYNKIYGELLAKDNLEPRDSYCFDKYVSDPRRVAPEKLKTEIYIPIQ